MSARKRSRCQKAYQCPYCQAILNTRSGYNAHVSKKESCRGKHRATVAGVGAGDGDSNSDEGFNITEGSLVDVDMTSNHSGLMSDVEATDAPEPEVFNAIGGVEEPLQRTRGTELFIEHYPTETAGAPIREATKEECNRQDHQNVGPLSDRKVFDVLDLLFASGMSGKKRTELLKLKRFQGVCPWNNNREMIQDIDTYLPRGPKWLIKTIKIVASNGVQYVQFWYRNALDGITSLCFESTFKGHIVWRPSRVWTNAEKTTWRHGETTTADRMWDLQDMIPDKYATVIPYFFASDETALTVIVGDQKAHPVYLTIGNLPKHLRHQVSKRAMILVGYIPVVSLKCEPNAEKQALLKRKLFHECMRALVAPLKEAGRIGAEVVCSDGFVRRIYPVFCGGMVDFPEQCKYAVIRNPFCPTCEVPADQRGDLTSCSLRDRQKTVEAIREHREHGSARFEALGLVDVNPFWDDLPWVDAGTICPPDLLHQLYKGVFKDHLVKWSAHIVGTKELDDRYKAMPEHHGLRHFKKGISKISRWTGREVKEQCKGYLPTVADQEHEVTSCARALMRFMYLAHSSELTDQDLDEMEECIALFHREKDVFIRLGALGEQDPSKKKGPVRTFNMIPKLHTLLHYIHYIRELGTPDGFNTELPERLHIPYAKVGFRQSNKRDVIKQMVTYFQRMEAIAMHRAYLDELDGHDADHGPDQYEEEELEEEEEYQFGEEEVSLEGMEQLSLEEDWGAEADEVEDEYEGKEEEEDEDEEAGEEDSRAPDMQSAVVDGELEDNEGDEVLVGLERRDVTNGTWDEVYNIDNETGDQVGSSIFHPNPNVKHAKKPTLITAGTHIISKHGATQLTAAIESFLRQRGIHTRDLDLSPRHKYRVWNRCRLYHSPPPFKPTEGERVDVIRAFPAVVDAFGRPCKEAQFDTALFVDDEDKDGLHRYRACRVRAIFELPENLRHLYDDKLVYAELFNPFQANPEVRTQLYKATHANTADGRRRAIVMPLTNIRMTCHIAPHYGTATTELDLGSERDILSSCRRFLFNEYGSFFMFELVHHWRRAGTMI